MACPDCGMHDNHSSSSEDDEEYGGFSSSDDSSSDESSPFFPFSGLFAPSPHLLVPTLDMLRFPFMGGPFQFMLELHRFQSQMTREQQRTQQAEERNRKRQLSSIATASFTCQNVNEKQCVICLEEFEEGAELKRLSCKHHYHSTCIDKWLVQNGKCPLCNSKAVNTLEEVQSKFGEAKRLRENAHKVMRKLPKTTELKAKRLEEIKKNPANPTGRKLQSKRKRKDTTPPFLRRQGGAPNNLFSIPNIFGGILPNAPVQTFGGAVDSDDEEEQIQQAIRESLRESEEMERKEKGNNS